MSDLAKHYSLLLGLDDAWQVIDVDLRLEEQKVEIVLEAVSGHTHCCPECGSQRPLKDHAPERIWRHLDTMQFETVLKARLPRTECSDCGVKTIRIPWADPHGRFTLMFEAFAIRVLEAAANVETDKTFLIATPM
ncbi:MAG: transposase family protein [Verrucomicrobiota bacterium]|nr:transposase family protein [Verrucomicrobiota bacterium]